MGFFAAGRATVAVLVAVFVAIVGGCAAERPPSAFEDAFNDDAKPWQEIAAQLPSQPADRNLVPFAVSGASTYRFAIDATSLSIGSDGVYRYTLVATSPQGVRNVSYEGIRCASNQKKLYATGRADGTWSRARNAAWTPIEEAGLNRQHAALEKEYFCVDGYESRTVASIFERMKPNLMPSEADFDRQVKGAER